MKQSYLEAVSLIERLHRLYLEVIKCELDSLRVRDINNVQALVLYNLGGDQISIGDLTMRGCYLGSNVTYNLKKMIANGYVEQISSEHDKRSSMIRLLPKGLALSRKLDNAIDKHLESLRKRGVTSLMDLVLSLRRLEEFWKSASVQKIRFEMKKR
ncbi:MAG: MarR family transcriptional regulator [Alphaproteobacteria bacterium]|nr:MarR family transcriptional regulator [Alphaproteobacteria bacterium]